jgi:hypothetical protein
MDSLHACRHDRTTAGYWAPKVAVNSSNRSTAAGSVGAVYACRKDWDVLAKDLRPVLVTPSRPDATPTAQ